MNSLEASLQNMLLGIQSFTSPMTGEIWYLEIWNTSLHHNQLFHTGQLKKEDIAQKGLLLLQIHTKTTFQPRVT